MSVEASYKKEVQDRKKEFQDKKVELISQLCTKEVNEKKKNSERKK